MRAGQHAPYRPDLLCSAPLLPAGNLLTACVACLSKSSRTAVATAFIWLSSNGGCGQGRDPSKQDVRDAILQLTVTEHYYTGVQDVVTLLCDFHGIAVKVRRKHHSLT